MWIHNPTCGCAECGNYGQVYNPRAIHNQSCGCAECGNYGNSPVTSSYSAPPDYSPSQTHDPVAQAIEFINTCGASTDISNPQALAASFKVLIAAIDASVAPMKQKREVKGLLEELMAHPLAVEALGALAEQLRKLLGKTTPSRPAELSGGRR